MGMPHGKAIGYFLAGYLAASPAGLTKEVLDIIGFNSPEEFSEFYRIVCNPETVPDDLIITVIDGIMRRGDKLAPCPFETSRQVVENIAFYIKKG